MSEEAGPSGIQRPATLSAKAAAARARREAETPDQRQARLQSQRERNAASRAAETPQQHQNRLQDQRQRRAAETNEQRMARQWAARERDGNRRRNAAAAGGQFYRAAILGAYAVPAIAHDLGPMTKECQYGYCRALHFAAEKGNLLHSCCHDGKVATPPLSAYPDPLLHLLTGNTDESRSFREHIRQYNNANAFASFGAKAETIPGQGPYCFKISGEVYHLATAALAPDPQQANEASQPRFGQVFVYDPDAAVNYRMQARANAGCDRRILEIIDQTLRQVNPYVDQYRHLSETAKAEEDRAQRLGIPPKQYELRLMRKESDDQRRYNQPITNSDCMYLIESTDGEVPAMDLAVHPRGANNCVRLNPGSRHVDPMIFVLFFPHGDAGYYIGVQNAIPLAQAPANLTPLQFYSNRIATRRDFNPLHHGGKLYQQYIVHAYCIIEHGRLMYIRTNQKQLRVECYQGLIDFLAEEARERGLRPGNLVILPSTFVGSPRYMREKYYDAMTIVRKFGRPDLFITFTCNPKWPEIVQLLQPYQDASTRPDIVARVFELKLEEMMHKIRKEKIFGTVVAFVYVIEFQKRGLPHVHALFWLAEEDQFHTGDEVDRVISAEIPDRAADPELYNIIMTNNIHGPCGVLNPNCICMKDGLCKKQFPKQFQDATDMMGEGYPKYRRRDNGNENHRVRNIQVDNRWVVPYNPYLSKMFNAHINVEMCHTIAAIKYLCKYFTKGHDRARAGLTVIRGQVVLNEINDFLDARCITPPEAAWRILENDIHGQSHAIYNLAVHLPDGQRIFFEEGQEEEAVRQAAIRDTTLTAWFKLNQNDPDARHHLYQDIPNQYVMEKTGGSVKWKPRQRDYPTIGRVASVSPRNVELYHLRLLLLNVPGATSFEYLRTVNGHLHNTFREAALALGLVVDDGEWSRCMTEASLYMMPYQLRSLFAIILLNCEVANANALWNEFKQHMTEDFRHHGNDEGAAETLALLQIQADLQAAGVSCTDKGIPEPGPMAEQPQLFNDDPFLYANEGQRMLDMLNQTQRGAADLILAAVNSNDNTRPRCFFIDGPGGTGKTFLYTTLINILRGMRKRVLSVAFTGIAAILLPGGKTCHTAFRLPLQLQGDSACHLSLAEKEALKNTDVIIWDEAPMAPSDMLQVVDRLLRDLMKTNVPFGAKIMVLGGDFRQVLPVVQQGTKQQIIKKCIKSSPLIHHFHRIPLTLNMRARPEEIGFARWLLELGDGNVPRPENALSENSIALPPQCVCNNVVAALFGDGFLPDNPEMHQRVVLCPTNEHARLKNEEILQKLQGQNVTLKSVDVVGAVEGEDEAALQQLYPTEFLNTVNLPGLPPHQLNIKKGAIVMLIRNLCIARGLCNGTRLIVMDAKSKVLQVKIISGAHRGTVHFLPRITLNTKDDVNVPFNLCRRQFPVKLAYAMTINKAQGQTFEKVGLFLSTPVFTHGQLYVACSRVRSFDSLFIQVLDNEQQGKIGQDTITDNIVFKEIL